MTTNIFQTQTDSGYNQTYSRRDALGLIAKALGVVSVMPAYKGIDAVLGNNDSSNSGYAYAQDKVVIGGLEREIVVPSDEELLRWMKDPVVDTLKSLKGNVVILDNPNDPNQDKNYVREVYQEHISPEKRQPVMSLFYSDMEPSRGNAALVRVINYNYPEIKAIGYRMTHSTIGVPPQRELDLRAKYGLTTVPAILFYNNINDSINYHKDISMMGGIKAFNFLKNEVNWYINNLSSELKFQ